MDETKFITRLGMAVGKASVFVSDGNQKRVIQINADILDGLTFLIVTDALNDSRFLSFQADRKEEKQEYDTKFIHGSKVKQNI